MIWLFILCLAVVAALGQRFWAEHALAHLRYSLTCQPTLAEADQPVTMVSTVENRARLPILYVRTRMYLPGEATLHGDGAWLAEHTEMRMAGLCVEDVFTLLPRRRRTARFQVSFPRRGRFAPTGVELITGDLLGSHTLSRQEFTFCRVVVAPPRCTRPELLQALDGFLGDISVRRFILEDPVLTVGFREYTGREPMKAISWPQSARMGRLIAKEYDHTTDLAVTVLLNTEGGTPAQLEQCYSLTRTACEELEKRGIPYDLRTNGDLVGPTGLLPHVPRGLGQQHFNGILYGLGCADYRCCFPLAELVQRCRGSQCSSQSYIVITPPLSPAAARLLALLESAGAAMTVLTGEEAVQ